MTAEELVYVLKAKTGDFVSGFKGAQSSAESGSRGILSSMTSLKVGMAAVWTAITGYIVSSVVRSGMEMAKLAGQGEGLRKAFNNLATAAGESSDKLLAALRRGTAGTVSDFKLIQEANRALISGLPATAEKMEQLAYVARGLGQAVGIDATEAFQRMVRGISKQEIELLDELFGGSVKFQAILQKLGPTASATEKQMAIYNKILEVGTQRVKDMGGAMLTYADRMAQAEARIENFKESLGRKLIPVIEKLIPIALSAADALAKLFGVQEISADPMKTALKEKEMEIRRIQGELDRLQAPGNIAPGFVVAAQKSQLRKNIREYLDIQQQMENQAKAGVEAKKKKEEREKAEAAKKAADDAWKAQGKGIEAGLSRAKFMGDVNAGLATTPRGGGWSPISQNVPGPGGAIQAGIGMVTPEDMAKAMMGEIGEPVRESNVTLEKMLREQGYLADNTSDTKMLISELTTLLDARTNRMIDSLFRLPRDINRISGAFGGGMGLPPGLTSALSKVGNFALGAYGAFTSLKGAFTGLSNWINGDNRNYAEKYGDPSTFSDDQLKSEIGRLAGKEDDYSRGMVNYFKAMLQNRQNQKTQEGDRTFSSAVTLTEGTGARMVASLNTIVSELQNGHLLSIRDMLAQGINVRASSLSVSMATDTTNRTRSAGLS